MTTRKDFGAAIQNAQLDVGPFMSPTPYTIQVRATAHGTTPDCNTDYGGMIAVQQPNLKMDAAIQAEATLSRVMHLFQGLGLRHLPVRPRPCLALANSL